MLYTEEEYRQAYRQGFNDAVHEFNEGYQIKDKTMNNATSRIVYRRHLPKLKPSVWQVNSGIKNQNIEDTIIESLNFLYASNYTIAKDFEIVLKVLITKKP